MSLPKDQQPDAVDLAYALRLLELPRTVGHDPDSGEEIVAGLGRFGPFVRRGKTFASLKATDELWTVELAHAKGHCLCEHEDAPGPDEGTDLDHPHGDCTDLPLPDHLAPAASHQGPASDQVDDPPDAPTVALLPARPEDRAPPSWLVYATGPPRPDSLLRLRRSVVLLL